MKKFALILLAAAMLVACGKTAENGNVVVAENGTMPSLNIAIVNADTLLANYEFAKVANEKLMKKQEDARLKINSQTRQLQNDMQDFQRKYENNAFLSRERAESEYNRLQKKDLELQKLDRTLTQDLLEEQQKLTIQLKDSLDAVIAFVNKDGKYDMILSTNSVSDNVLFVKEQFDITNEVLEALNQRYKGK